MKHLLTFLLLFFAVGFCSAQSEHMKFKGIPMEGTLNSFVDKLKSKGYTYMGQQDGIALLQGEFAATKDCTIGVARFADKDQVNMVVVLLPGQKSWSSITSDYYTFKNLLTEKYGTPNVTENFSDREPTSDFSKFYALLNDECHFLSEFTTNNSRKHFDLSKIYELPMFKGSTIEDKGRKTILMPTKEVLANFLKIRDAIDHILFCQN